MRNRFLTSSSSSCRVGVWQLERGRRGDTRQKSLLTSACGMYEGVLRILFRTSCVQTSVEGVVSVQHVHLTLQFSSKHPRTRPPSLIASRPRHTYTMTAYSLFCNNPGYAYNPSIDHCPKGWRSVGRSAVMLIISPRPLLHTPVQHTSHKRRPPDASFLERGAPLSSRGHCLPRTLEWVVARLRVRIERRLDVRLAAVARPVRVEH